MSNRALFRYFAIDHYRGVLDTAEDSFYTDDYRESFSLGAYLPSHNIFGLAERPDNFKLGTTESSDPYRLHGLDVFPRAKDPRQPLYSSLPYVTAHGQGLDASVLWMSSSETWADIYRDGVDGSLVNFVSESGRLEFFLFGSIDGPKTVQRTLAKITGFMTLPPIFALGYHYSKWESLLSSSTIHTWNSEFTRYRIPVDSFWLDITYAGESYF